MCEFELQTSRKEAEIYTKVTNNKSVRSFQKVVAGCHRSLFWRFKKSAIFDAVRSIRPIGFWTGQRVTRQRGLFPGT